MWTEEQKLQLISEVREFPALWDASHRDHKNRPRMEEIWNEIFAARGDDDHHSMEDIRKQWKNLRDSFFKQKRRTEQSLEATGDFDVPKWKFFEQLLFLVPDYEKMYHARLNATLPTSLLGKRSPTDTEESGSNEESSPRPPKSPKQANLPPIPTPGQEPQERYDRFTGFGNHVAETYRYVSEKSERRGCHLEVRIRRAMLEVVEALEEEESEDVEHP